MTADLDARRQARATLATHFDPDDSRLRDLLSHHSPVDVIARAVTEGLGNRLARAAGNGGDQVRQPTTISRTPAALRSGPPPTRVSSKETADDVPP